MKYWEMIADRLHAEGWSWGYCSAVTRDGWRWIVDAIGTMVGATSFTRTNCSAASTHTLSLTYKLISRGVLPSSHGPGVAETLVKI
jgi:hypothetical protein